MKKKMIAGLLGAVLLCGNPFPAFVGGVPDVAIAAAQAASETRPLRYFMQPEGVSGVETPYGNNPSVGRYVQAGDAKIYYEVYGKGTPVFVFHGGGVGTPYEMGQIIDRLRQDYQVIVVSTRGHGRSEIGHSPLTYEQKAEDMRAVMREVTDAPTVLVGFSDGAYTAYKLAAMRPEAVERVVAIGAGTLRKGFFAAGTLTVAEMEKIDKAFIEQQRSVMPEPERLQEFWTRYTDFWSQTEVGAELFGAIRCPVLLIAGDEDDHAPIATMMEAERMIPNARLCIVPKAWHTAFLDNFPVTWAAMEDFLRQDAKDLASSRKVEYNAHWQFTK